MPNTPNSSQSQLTACCWTRSASRAAAACCRCCCSCCTCTCSRCLTCAWCYCCSGVKAACC